VDNFNFYGGNMRVFIVLLICLLNSGCSPADAKLSLCQPSEAEVFNCQIKNKLLSVCASSSDKSKEQLLQYRYGTTSSIELNYPENPAVPSGHFMSSSVGYSGGGEFRIHFKNNDFDYILFDRTIRTGFDDDGNKPEFSAGIAIKESGKVKSVHKCSNNTQIIVPENMTIPEEEFDDSIIID
jgi:hypothetical protein